MAALLFSASLVAGPPALALEAQEHTGSLPHGGAYVMAADAQSGTAAVDLWFRAPGAGYDLASPGIARLAATAAAAGKLQGGKSLVEFVRSVGGRFSLAVYPDMLGVSVVVPATQARRAVAVLTAAYFAPEIDADAVKAAQRDAAVVAVEQRYSPDAALHNLLFSAVFPSGAAHVAPVPENAQQITAIAPNDITAYAKRAFRSSNAILSLAGNVDEALLAAVTDGSQGAMPPPIDSTVGAATTVNAQGAVNGIGFAYVGPPIADERAATAMDFIADYLFRDGSGVVTRALAHDDETYAAGQFITLHNPGVLVVTIGGKNLSAARTAVRLALEAMQQPLDPALFSAAREAFLYHLATDTASPAEEADNLGWYAVEGNAGYAPGLTGGSYVRAARALDPTYVASIAQKYLAHPTIVQLSASTKGST